MLIINLVLKTALAEVHLTDDFVTI